MRDRVEAALAKQRVVQAEIAQLAVEMTPGGPEESLLSGAKAQVDQAELALHKAALRLAIAEKSTAVATLVGERTALQATLQALP